MHRSALRQSPAGPRAGRQRRARFAPHGLLCLLLCLPCHLAGADTCRPLPEEKPAPDISLAAVRTGAVSANGPIARVLVQAGEGVVPAAVLTDASRPALGEGWPPFPRDTRLLLVSLDSGQPLWSLARGAAMATPDRLADPRLLAPFGRSAALVDPASLLQRLYVGDDLGRVWRVDLPPLSHPADAVLRWQLALLADLGPGARPGPPIRQAPDLIRSVDAAGHPFDGVLVATDSDEAAGEAGAGLFLLRDYSTGARPAGAAEAAPITREQLDVVARDCAEAEEAATACGRGPGWFAPYQHAGERARGRPLTDGGRVFLITAAAADCPSSPLILSYIFKVADGRPLPRYVPASVLGRGGLPGLRIEAGEIVLPGSGMTVEGDDGPDTQGRFTRSIARGRLTYWRDLLLDRD